MKNCIQCGQPLRDEMNFCPVCGTQQSGGKPEKRALKWWYIALPVLVVALAVAAVLFLRGRSAAPKEEGTVAFEGHSYKLYPADTVDSWEDAQAFCEEKGGYLATINSQAENDFLYDYIRGEGCETAYFGFTDRESEGAWTWITGEKSAYTNWYEGEPNNDLSGENYGAFYFLEGAAGRWFDGDFGQESNGGNAFLCEWGDYVTEEADTDYYAAYSQIVSERQASYGEGRYIPATALYLPDAYMMDGVAIVRLLDMNNDGVEELLLCYQQNEGDTIVDRAIEVWTYADGAPKQLYRDYPGGIGDVGSACLFLIRLDGEWLLRDGGGSDIEFNIRYLGIRDGALAPIHTLDSENKYPDGCLIDGQQVTADEFVKQDDAWRREAVYYLFLTTTDQADVLRETEAVCAKLRGEAPQAAPEATPAQTAPAEADLYAGTISEFKAYMQRLSASDENALEEMTGKGYSYVYRYEPASIGYAIQDVDGDGVKELLIGEGENIYDLFTIVQGKVVHVNASGERYMLSLCTDGPLREVASGSAFDTTYSYFTLRDGKLALREAYRFDANYAEEHGLSTMWFHVTSEPVTADNGTPVTDEAAQQVTAARTGIPISYTPFA